jgi:hypothetical protein
MMQKAVAIDRTRRMNCLVGQYRFTEWMVPEAPDETVRRALAALAPEGFDVVEVSTSNGVVTAKVKSSLIPKEILSWFTHFERKGVPAAIVKKRAVNEYAVLREGVDHVEDDEEVPEAMSRTDIFILKACHGFKLRTEEY